MSYPPYGNPWGWPYSPPPMYPPYPMTNRGKDYDDPVSDITKHIKAMKALKKMMEAKKPDGKEMIEKPKPTLFKPWEVFLLMAICAIPVAVAEGFAGKILGVLIKQIIFGP